MAEKEKKAKEEPKAKKAEKAPKEEKPAETKKEEGPSSRKKINRLTLEEIEAKLAEIKTSQGGWHSKFAQHLLRRKKSIGS